MPPKKWIKANGSITAPESGTERKLKEKAVEAHQPPGSSPRTSSPTPTPGPPQAPSPPRPDSLLTQHPSTEMYLFPLFLFPFGFKSIKINYEKVLKLIVVLSKLF